MPISRNFLCSSISMSSYWNLTAAEEASRNFVLAACYFYAHPRNIIIIMTFAKIMADLVIYHHFLTVFSQKTLWFSTQTRLMGKFEYDSRLKADLIKIINLSLNKLVQAESSWAELSRAEPSWAELSRAELSRAEPSQAELSWAKPSWAKLSQANPSQAEPSCAMFEQVKKVASF